MHTIIYKNTEFADKRQKERRMKSMKRVLAFILMLATLISLFACGEYSPAAGGQTGPGSSNQIEQPSMNDDPTDDFTVTVTLNGMPYIPKTDMHVIWTSGFGVYKAPLGVDGVARIDGLDGDFRVTLSSIPDGYTYNPNVNYATNDRKNITLELYTLNKLTGSGTGSYDSMVFKNTGVYSAVIENAGDGIYFEYAPTTNGVYTIESWIDTTADNVNPYIEVYEGSWAWKQYETTINDGGPEGSYTKNFVHEVKIAEQNISSTGQVVFSFVIKAESKNDIYPINVTFAVTRNGDFDLPSGSDKTVVVPKLDFNSYDISDHEYDDSLYTQKYLEYEFEGLSNTYVFDDSRVKLWRRSEGGDDFYHVYDTQKYASTGGYGPILYANITSELRLISTRENKISFISIEYGGDRESGDVINAALTVGGVNYKHFIEGYTFLSTFGNINDATYYCVGECPCHSLATSRLDWACSEDCQSCHENCRSCPAELVGNEGYQSIANSDGMVAVTEELKVFLEEFVKSKNYFLDGEGFLDSDAVDGKYYQAVNDSGWLFTCTYYEAK